MDVKWIESHSPPKIKNLSGFKNEGEISLYLKHEEVLKEQIEKGYERVLILEDDVLIEPDFPSLYNKCILEFNQINGDIMFIGECCGIKPIDMNKLVSFHESYTTRCAHCYVVSLRASKIIYECVSSERNCPWDFKLNEVIQSKKLKSCYTSTSVFQNRNFPSALGNG
jgi:GR25 family glycosyltransferase involved in LPS biosynthesis